MASENQATITKFCVACYAGDIKTTIFCGTACSAKENQSRQFKKRAGK